MPKALRRVARRDRHGGICQSLHDDDRPPAQGWVFLLLARRKEGVEIEEQPLHRILDRLHVHLLSYTISHGQESRTRPVPPRYAFRLEDLRVFHFVRQLPCLRAQGDHSKRSGAAGPAGLHAPDLARTVAVVPKMRDEREGHA
jgi:hypothetical protein